MACSGRGLRADLASLTLHFRLSASCSTIPVALNTMEAAHSHHCITIEERIRRSNFHVQDALLGALMEFVPEDTFRALSMDKVIRVHHWPRRYDNAFVFTSIRQVRRISLFSFSFLTILSGQVLSACCGSLPHCLGSSGHSLQGGVLLGTGSNISSSSAPPHVSDKNTGHPAVPPP